MAKQQRRVLKSSLYFAGAVALIALFTFLLNVDINRRTRKVETKRFEVQASNFTLAQLGLLKQDEEKRDALFEIAQSALPNRDDLITFPREIEDMAIKHDLGYGFSFGSEQEAQEGIAGSIQYKLSLSGDIDNIKSFLKDFESLPMFISMNSVNFSENPGSGGFSFQTNGEIFTQ